VSDTNKPGAIELKALMARVLESDAAEAFGHFIVRQIALRDMAPAADEALLDGIEDSPDGGAAMPRPTCSGGPITSARRSSNAPPPRQAAGFTRGLRLFRARSRLVRLHRRAPKWVPGGQRAAGGSQNKPVCRQFLMARTIDLLFMASVPAR
jgi:hypothetical protein